MSQKFLNPVEVNGQVSAEYLDLSTTTTHVVNAGEIAWNSVDGTFDIGLLNGVTLQAGQEMHFYGKATEAISNGNAVMFAGVQGDHILIAKADAATINANPEYFMGVATQDFTTNEFGYVTAFGNVRGLNTVGYTLGSVLYYDSTTATDGLLTSTMPSAPNAKILVAAVVRVHSTQGILMVRPHTMPKISDIQDVNTSLSKTTPIDADSLLLQDSADSSIWKKLSWSNTKATLKTYFDTIYQSVLTNPVTGTGTTNYVPKFTGTSAIGNSNVYDDGTNVGIGTSSPGFPLEVNGAIVSKGGGTGGLDGTIGLGALGTSLSGNALLGEMYFKTGGSEKMRINISGNVGIGTSTPSQKLSVNGNIETTGSGKIGFNVNDSYGDFPHYGLGYPGGATLTNLAGYFGLSFGTVGTERMRITSGGNVGIGTTSPTGKLSSVANMAGWAGWFENQDATGVGSGLVVRAASNSGGFTFLLQKQDATSTFAVTGSGNVGVGTTSPGVRFVNTGAGNASGPTLGSGIVGAQALLSGNGLYGMYSGVSNSGDVWHQVQRNDANTSVYNLLLQPSGGNVGIGTTSPSGKLDVIGNLYTSGELRIGASYAATGTGLIKSNSGVLSLFTWGDSTNIQIGGNDVIFKPESGSERMRLTSAGNLGIGVSAPGYKTQIETASSVVLLSKNTSSTSFNRSYFYNNSDVGIQIQAYGSAYPFGTTWPGGANSADITCNAANGLSIGTSTASAFVLGTNSAERMRIDSSGNILVGQTSAIYSATNRANLTIGKSAGSMIVLGTSTASNGYLFFDTTNIELSNSTPSGSVFFRTAGTERMRINSSGNVGIGITSPSEKLEVQNGTSGAKIKVSNTGGGYATLECSSNATSVAQLSFTNQLSLIGGNVGIGTTSPGAMLHVVGDSYVQSGAFFSDTIGSYSTGNVTLWPSTNLIVPSGNTGIGTTTPDASAILQLDSTTQGFLLPRMGNKDMVNISSPAQGLMVFNTDNNVVCVYDGSTWQRLAYI